MGELAFSIGCCGCGCEICSDATRGNTGSQKWNVQGIANDSCSDCILLNQVWLMPPRGNCCWESDPFSVDTCVAASGVVYARHCVTVEDVGGTDHDISRLRLGPTSPGTGDFYFVLKKDLGVHSTTRNCSVFAFSGYEYEEGDEGGCDTVGDGTDPGDGIHPPGSDPPPDEPPPIIGPDNPTPCCGFPLYGGIAVMACTGVSPVPDLYCTSLNQSTIMLPTDEAHVNNTGDPFAYTFTPGGDCRASGSNSMGWAVTVSGVFPSCNYGITSPGHGGSFSSPGGSCGGGDTSGAILGYCIGCDCRVTATWF